MKQKRTLKPGLFGLQMVLLILFGSPTVAHAQDSPARAKWKSWEQKLKYDAIYTSDGEYETEMGEDGNSTEDHRLRRQGTLLRPQRSPAQWRTEARSVYT